MRSMLTLNRRVWAASLYSAFCSVQERNKISELMTKSTPPLHLAAFQGNITALAALLDSGTPVDEPAACGFTALIIASHAGRADAVRLLIDRGGQYEGNSDNC